jgi:hypothetical protein
MNITPLASDLSIKMPQNERLNALKVKEVMPEAEFTGLSDNVRVDSNGGRWFTNNDSYTKTYSKYDAYAYEWTVSTGSDYRSSYIENHPTEGMNFSDFLGYVRENGLDKELNASAIKADVTFSNGTDYSSFSQQTDYLAAYYVQLENHIDLNFSGNEKSEQLKILTDTIGKAIDDTANAYADYAGGFLEKTGQTGEREKVYSSVKNLIADKIDSYREFVSENPDFASLKGTEDEWLSGSHRFMTSELQKAYAASGKSADGTGTYSETDLLYIGKIASSFPTDLQNVSRIADEETIGFTLGTVMVKAMALGDSMNVSSGAANAVKGAVSHYEQDYMDLIDKEMEDRRNHAINSREREGYDPLDREAVLSVAEKMQIEYENTQNLMKALFSGVAEGFNNHMNKVNTGSSDKQLRYNENNKGFWLNMYSTLDKTESTSRKIERDALIFQSGLDSKNLDLDMGYTSLGTGYFTFGGYTAGVSGEIVSELAGIRQ